ncbi:MAG TPA: DUF3037 domain-containing protein [Thermoanaerobaculia bacterium]|nr:DUF3037 domain-containing protein [Thermoanaerobaculia bacterium]
MSAPLVDYDYAVVRLVPHVHLETFVNVGVVLHARQRRFLGVRLRRDHVAAACPDLPLARFARFLDAYECVCAGGAEAGALGLLPPSERFHWLTAPRSAVLQCSAVHGGRSADPAATLEALFREYVAG